MFVMENVMVGAALGRTPSPLVWAAIDMMLAAQAAASIVQRSPKGEALASATAELADVVLRAVPAGIIPASSVVGEAEVADAARRLREAMESPTGLNGRGDDAAVHAARTALKCAEGDIRGAASHLRQAIEAAKVWAR